MSNVNQKLMRRAGFKHLHESPRDYTVWGRGALRICASKTKPLALKTLVGYVINQTIFRVEQNSYINYQKFPTENK